MSVFTWPARVYWEDTDAGGIVYYANYLRFLERARTEWLRAKGFSQAQLAEDPGVLFTVVSVEAHYKRPARLDDSILITCEPRAEGRATLGFGQRILRGEELLLEATVRVACLAAKSLRPVRLPARILAEVD